MKKNTKTLHSGFTIAELLISMFVVMVIAAAMVPIIGPKKLKIPNEQRSHGVFECYYDEEGNLIQYTANNRNDRDGRTKNLGDADHCTFSVQSADKYEIYAIGAGSDGYQNSEGLGFEVGVNNIEYSNRLYIYNPAAFVGYKYAVLNNHFYTSFNLAPIDAAGKAHPEIFFDRLLPSGGEERSRAVVLRDMMNTWADAISETSGGTRDLYVAFTDLKGPHGSGGSGQAVRYASNSERTPNGYAGSYTNCNDICLHEPLSCRGPYRKPGEDPYWRSTDDLFQIEENALNNGMCYWYIHYSGADSEKARAMDTGDVILFPVDGDYQSGSSLTVQFNSDRARIGAKVRGLDKENFVELKKKANGNSAYKGGTMDTWYKGTGFDGDRLANAFRNDSSSGVKKMIRYIVNATGRNENFILGNTEEEDGTVTGHISMGPDRFGHGATHGLESGSGGAFPGGKAEGGEAKYARDGAFEWKYTGLGIDLNYGQAGEAGEVNIMVYNNLRGVLYLYPGKSFGDTAVDTVVSKSEDRSDTTGYITTAQSRTNRAKAGTYNTLLSQSIIPYPPEELRNMAKANNEALDSYVSRINSVGFRGGLFHCNDTGACPGYAGSGAYPFVNFAQGENTLTITDIQDAYKNPGMTFTKKINGKDFTITKAGDYSIMRKYPIQMVADDPSGENASCEYGEPIIGSEHEYVKADGSSVKYSDAYCIASKSRRRDGAVVIVW